MKRSHILALLLWTVIFGLFFGTLLLAVERLPNSDLSGQFHAFGLFQAQEISGGKFPLWSPGSYGGIPFTADTQAAAFYPPRFLTILLSLPGGFSYYALELEGLIHIWLAGAAAYVLAFDITRNHSNRNHTPANRQQPSFSGMKAEHWAGLTAAVAFGLGGYLTSYPLLQLAVLESIAWLPLVLFLLRRTVSPYEKIALEKRLNVPAMLAAGLVLGISALAGHPQTFLHASYLAAVYYFFLAWQARWRVRWTLGVGVVIAAVALGIAAAAFFPAIRFLPMTVRGDVSYEFVAKGFPLLQYVQTLFPGLFSVWLPQYAGIVTVFLVLFAWLGRHQWQEHTERAETIFWFVVILVAAWLSLGDKGVLFELAYRAAPGFSLFRQQERLASLFVLGMAILGAQGLMLWMRANDENRRLWIGRSSAVLAVSLLLIGVLLFMSRTAVGNNDWFTLWMRQWLLAIATAALLWPRGTVPNAKRDGRLSFVLLLLLCLDLFFPVRGAMDLQRESPAVFWPQPAWLDILADEQIVRIDGQNLFHANIGELYGLEDIRGISPLKPQLTANLEDLPRGLRWQLLNVKYVLAESPIAEGLSEVAEISESILPGEDVQAFVYLFEEALPRAWMVYNPVFAPDDEAAFKLIRQPGFSPVDKVILTGQPSASVRNVTPPSQTPLVEIERLSSSTLSFLLDTETPGVLVVSEWALPGWQATMDGLAVPLLQANYALQAIFVPEGRHEVLLSYGAVDTRIGISISLITLLLTFLAAWRWRPVITRRPERELIENSAELYARWPAWKSSLSFNQSLWILVGILMLGFALRVFLLGNQELRGDEAFSYLLTQLPFADVVPELIEQGDPHSPLHYLLLNAWVDVAGKSEFAMRWLSLLPGFLLIPVIYRLGTVMAGRKAGLLAAFLTAMSASLVWLSQDVRNQYTLAIFITSLATWLLVNIGRLTANHSKGRTVGLWAIYVILSAIAVYSHYYAVFALLSHGLFLWFQPERWRNFLTWLVSGIAAALLFLPWPAAVISELLKAGQLSDPATPELARYLMTVGQELIIGATLPGRWTRWLVIGLAVVVLVGFIALNRRKKGWAAMLMGWLTGAILVIFLIRFNRSTFNAFYVSVAFPAWILLLSAGSIALWQRGGWRRLVTLISVIALTLSSIASLRNYYFDPAHSRSLGYREVAGFLNDRAREGDIFIAHFPDPSLDYYLQDVPMPRQLHPSRAGQSVEETEKALMLLAENHFRMWLVPYHRSVWDRENVVPRWLANNNLQELETQLHRMSIYAFRPVTKSNELVLPLNRTLNEEILLEGAFVRVDGRPVDFKQPVTLSAGTQIDTTLIWSSLQETPRGYTAFVHLLDQNGFLLAQHDGIPAEGTRPTMTWQQGDQILDVHELVVPDGVQGSGRLVVGLYDSETLQRQNLAPEQDVLQLLNIRFK